MEKEKSLTRKQLVKLTGAKPYTIAYLKDCGSLSIIKESSGSGYPIIYHSDCVDIVKRHLQKNNNESTWNG